MIEFEVNDMTCGHCISAITRAITTTTPNAIVNIDLATHRVRVEGVSDADAVERDIREAGYTPERKS